MQLNAKAISIICMHLIWLYCHHKCKLWSDEAKPKVIWWTSNEATQSFLSASWASVMGHPSAALHSFGPFFDEIFKHFQGKPVTANRSSAWAERQTSLFTSRTSFFTTESYVLERGQGQSIQSNLKYLVQKFALWTSKSFKPS